MKKLGLLLCVLTAGCEFGDVPVNVVLDPPTIRGLTCKELPYEDGGAFTVEIGATVPGLDRPTRATVEIVEPFGLDEALRSKTITLIVDDEANDRVVGSAKLAVPAGGPVRVNVAIATTQESVAFTIASPRLEIDTGASELSPLFERWPMCVASNAAGDIMLRAVGARLGDDVTKTVTLARDVCVVGTEDLPFGAKVEVFPTADTFGLIATHTVAPNLRRETMMLTRSAPSPIDIELTPVPADLPSPGELVEITVEVERDGAPISDAPVTFDVVPSDLEVVPSAPKTDASGTAVVHFRAPASGEVRVEAIVGERREGVTLR